MQFQWALDSIKARKEEKKKGLRREHKQNDLKKKLADAFDLIRPNGSKHNVYVLESLHLDERQIAFGNW